MTIEWLQTWIIPLFWNVIDAVWVIVAVLLFRILRGKATIALLLAAIYSFLLSCFSTVETYLGNLPHTSQILNYENPLNFILFDVSWPFSLFCLVVFMGIATIRIHAIVRRNKELESLVANTLPSTSAKASRPH